MQIIVHLIRLRPGTDPAAFESWVREVDYRTCPELPSVIAFSVQRISGSAHAAAHYFEIIQVTGAADFERDMGTPAFQGLVRTFETMATVTAEFSGDRLDPAYSAV
ncbi:RedY protein [Actinomadura rubrisoli]|uniref:RedY protein n=1 Tax=Actinomadura rubrisoli TaxID=2530368 RepID=A0A4R5B686_9ACTN|nr:RedY protein [Actinomadura rubrisoli]TDD80533.1 RedY protein [Actinomadura rubrisoli]